MMPSFFIAHGAPSLVLEEHQYTNFLKEFSELTEKPKAIVLFSAHWEQPTQSIGAVAEPYSTIYDFGGFQDELYLMTYPAPGDRGLAEEIRSLFAAGGIESVLDEQRGLDHGAWAILKLMYPEADIPVVALSVNRHLTNAQQYEIGKALTSLREQGVLIIGSGGTVHNLRKVRWNAENIDSWALAFDDWLQSKLEAWDTDSLFQYREIAPGGIEAVPTNEHFIPLLLAMGAGDNKHQAELLFRGYQHGNLSLSCWKFH